MKDTVCKFFFEILTIDTFFLCIFAIVKIQNAIQSFAEYIAVERRLSPGTVKYYVGVVKQFAQYLEREHVSEVEDIKGADVRGWQMSLINDGKRPGTVVRDMAAVRAWVKYLRLRQGLKRDIMAKAVTPKKTLPKTGDTYDPMLTASIATLGLLAMAIGLRKKRKEA